MNLVYIKGTEIQKEFGRMLKTQCVSDADIADIKAKVLEVLAEADDPGPSMADMSWS